MDVPFLIMSLYVNKVQIKFSPPYGSQTVSTQQLQILDEIKYLSRNYYGLAASLLQCLLNLHFFFIPLTNTKYNYMFANNRQLHYFYYSINEIVFDLH